MVLDIAAGANNSVYYPPGFDMSRVLAVDISQPALDLNSSGHKLHADVRQPLKLQDSSFDLTLSVYGMRYFENQEAVILEMLRVTKPEAWVVMIDLFNAVNKDAVRRFDVRQLTTFIAANTNVVDLHTERLHQGCNIESSINLLAIQKLAPSSNFT